MKVKEIKTYADLPPYGTYVGVSGIDEKQYGIRGWHICEMNDLQDGMEFQESGEFLWLTENGTRITQVTHWFELPTYTNQENLQDSTNGYTYYPQENKTVFNTKEK